MAAQHDLPMGARDESARAEGRVLTLLRSAVPRAQALLASMKPEQPDE